LVAAILRVAGATAGLVDCRLTAKNWDMLWNPTLPLRLPLLSQQTDRPTQADIGDVVTTSVYVAVYRQQLTMTQKPVALMLKFVRTWLCEFTLLMHSLVLSAIKRLVVLLWVTSVESELILCIISEYP